MGTENKKNSIIGGLFWKFGERLISQGVSFLISLVLARLLSPDDYGTIALVTVFINLAAVFITSGFATALIQRKDATSTDFSTMFYCSLAASIVIYLILFFTAPLVANFYENPLLTKILRVFSLQIPLSVFYAIQTAYVSRNMLFQKAFMASTIAAIISGVIGIALAYIGFGVWALVAQSILAVIVNSLVLGVALPWRLEAKFSKKSAKEMMSYGSKILAADLSGTFFAEVRSLIIGKAYTSADLAFYNKGQQLPSLITNNLSTSVMTVMFPAFANESDNFERVKEMSRKSMQVLSFIMFPCMFGLAAVMEPLIIFLYTDKWAPCIPYAQILSIGLCVGILGIIPLQILKAIGRSDVVLGLEIWKKPVYVLLLIISVNINVFAIAVAMTIYDFYGVFVNMLQAKKHINYKLREQAQDLLPAFLLSFVMALTVLLIPTLPSLLLTLVIKVLAGVVIFVGGSIIFKPAAFVYLKDLLLSKLKKG